MRHALWGWLAVILCLGREAFARSTPAKGKDPPDREPPLQKYCGDDLKLLCPDSSKVFELYCLYENKGQLSEACLGYLGSTTIGGCNDAAMTLCKEFETAPAITNCLFNHSQSLSEDCLRNLENSKDASNPIVEEQEQYLHATMASALLAFIALAIPLLAFLWALHTWYILYQEQRRVLRASPEYIKAHSEVLQLVRACDRPSPSQSPPSSSSMQAEEHSWTLSFRSISYWTEERGPILPFLSTNKSERKQILHEISGECKAKTITAIMGPSGSGKTTLLQLLGGQTYSGQYAGYRAINGHVFPKSQYDEIMRRQGFVAQGDRLLPGLTVWQTLLFAAMLRLPDEMTVHHKLCRAAYIMHDVGLSAAAHVPVGGAGGDAGGGGAPATGAGSKGISGGQRRRLSIALEVLSNPSTLLLDEPTSGLDSASTLRIVHMLRHMTRTSHTTIALTIHQPRAEVFELFDSLVLLGSGGYLVYCGDCDQAVSVLSSAPCIQARPCSYTNPGDFIIDILGLSSAPDGDDRSSPAIDPGEETSTANNNSPQGATDGDDDEDLSSLDTSSHRLLGAGPAMDDDDASLLDDRGAPSSGHRNVMQREMADSTRSLGGRRRGEARPVASLPRSQTLQLRDHFGQSATFQQLDAHLAALLPQGARSGSGSGSGSSSLDYEAGREGEASGLELRPLSRGREDLPHPPLTVLGGEDCLHSPAARLRGRLERMAYPSRLPTQVSTLAARRSLACLPSPLSGLTSSVQLSAVCIAVVWTLSYRVSSSLEAPYQVVLLLAVLSLYLAVEQYVHRVPEALHDRPALLAEMTAREVAPSAALLSAVVTEVPRAVLQAALVLAWVQGLHEVNPLPAPRAFRAACLALGLVAWQSLIGLCVAATDRVDVAYAVLFLVLGAGSLFGGLLVRYSKLPHLFRPLYHLSVTAVTQRALIANDLRCCYLSATCNSIAHDLHSDQAGGEAAGNTSDHRTTTFCPPGLEFTGDGSDLGNLGRLYLMGLDLQHEHPMVSILFLLAAAVVFRLCAVGALTLRLSWKDQLVEVAPPPATLRR